MRNAATAVLLCIAGAGPAPAAELPVAGSVAVYQVTNGNSREVVAQVRYVVEKVEGDRVTFSVASDRAGVGAARTEIATRDGSWLRRAVASHGDFVLYDFREPLPAYQFPLDGGKKWSRRVPAQASGSGSRSVRMDVSVLGTERVKVPAGEFDTIKLRRSIYPGDQGSFLDETQVGETDWYAPAIGRSVRTETRSQWMDNSMGRIKMTYGGWYITELAALKPAGSR